MANTSAAIPGYPRQELGISDEQRAARVAARAGEDAALLGRPENELGMWDYFVKRPAAERRTEYAATQQAVPVEGAPPRALTNAGPAYLPPPVTLADVGVPAVTARGAVDNARRDTNANVATSRAIQGAADRNQYENLRRQLGTYDVKDIEAERARQTALAGGNLPMIAANALDERQSGRRAAALNALKAIDTNAHYVRNDAKANRAADEVLRSSQYSDSLKTMSATDKEYMATLDLLSEPANKGNPVLLNKLAALESMKEQEEGMGANIGTGMVPEGGNFVQKRAEGGEIEAMLGGMAPPPMPEAVPTAPMDLDSGDYIIPVEAMRFYGRKFFQDLINKAEDTE